MTTTTLSTSTTTTGVNLASGNDGTLTVKVGATAGAQITAMSIDAAGSTTFPQPAAMGYGTGAGGAVTQATSRTTAVTISKPTGTITMFTAAGSATPSQFTVTNSLVAVNDVILLSYKGSSNVYQFIVSTVASGSFNITFWSQSGTVSATPVINFVVIKGANS